MLFSFPKDGRLDKVLNSIWNKCCKYNFSSVSLAVFFNLSSIEHYIEYFPYNAILWIFKFREEIIYHYKIISYLLLILKNGAKQSTAIRKPLKFQ